MKHIFEPFFTTKEVGEGTGLGLAAVYGTVRGHYDALRVSTVVGKGTTFRLYLPLCESAEAAPRKVSSRRPVRGRGRILVVDDEDSVRRLATTMLRRSGCRVLEAPDGRRALEIFGRFSRRIDLALVDLQMPSMSGEDVNRRMRRIQPRIPILIVSGCSLDPGSSFQGKGRSEVLLQKPFSLADLSRAVATTLGERASEAEAGQGVRTSRRFT